MSTKLSKVKIKETATKFRLLQCIRLLGDLSIHLSGESKVMFKTKDDETYFTYYGVTLSGDQGCVKPLDDSPCALDELKKLFTRFEPWMYQNDESQEYYITEEFKHWISNDVAETIHKHFIEDERTEIVTCEYYPKGEIDPIAIITVTALSNPFVIDIYEEFEGSNATYIGEITKIFPVPEGRRYNLIVKNKKKEEPIEIDLDEAFLMIGISDIYQAHYLYLDSSHIPILSSVKMHGKKKGVAITDVHRS